MHIDGAAAPDASGAAVDELIDALSALVRTWRHAGRRIPGGMQSSLALLQLAGLLDDGEYRLGEIADRRGVDQSVVSRQIGELESRGLVGRRPDPSDGRASLVRLTPAGREVLGNARRLEREIVHSALARTESGDVRTVARLVAGLAEELNLRLGEADLLTGART